MKSEFALSLLALCLIAGCASDSRIDTSGAHPALGKHESMTPQAREAEVDTGRILVNAHSGYTVYTVDGLKVAHETNAPGAELKLAPGRYFVRLDKPVQGPREFWVTVERAKLTRVEYGKQDAPPVVR